jgi:ATP phosphoribosyltransferase regulatory subunit HisZ
MNNQEFIIWGIAPGQSMEDVLFTDCKTLGEAKRAVNALILKHSCKAVRIQILDLSKPFDFVKEFCKK